MTFPHMRAGRSSLMSFALQQSALYIFYSFFFLTTAQNLMPQRAWQTFYNKPIASRLIFWWLYFQNYYAGKACLSNLHYVQYNIGLSMQNR